MSRHSESNSLEVISQSGSTIPAWKTLLLAMISRPSTHLLFASLLLIQVSACRNDGTPASERDRVEKLLSQAEVLISLAPDSVIHYTDSALRLASSMSSDDPTVLRLQVIRAEALIQRKRFEEATAILEPLHYHAHEQVQEELNYRTSFLLGKAFLSTGKAKLAHTFLTEAHDLQGEALKAGELAELWAMMGELSILNGKYSKANEYLGKASRLLDSMDNQKRVPGLSRYKAISIMGSGDTTEALNVLKEALTEAIQRKDTIEWFQCLYLHASAVGRQDPELANTLFRQAFGIMESNPFQADLNRARLDHASLLHALNQNQEAIGLLRDQLETARASGDATGKLSIALRLSAILEDEGALDQALVWLDTAEQHIQHAPRTAMVYELVDRRARVLRRKGQPDKAFLSLSQSDQLIDSVSNRIRHEAAMEMDQVFRNERQGIQNDLLQSQLNREITLQRLLIGTLIAISIVALILGLLLRQRRELNQHLGNAYNVLMAKYRPE